MIKTTKGEGIMSDFQQGLAIGLVLGAMLGTWVLACIMAHKEHKRYKIESVWRKEGSGGD